MKITLKSTLFLLGISLGGFALFSLASEDDCRIPNGKEGWPVVFEDTGLSRKEKQAIIDDYRSICARLSPQGSYETKTLKGEPIRWMRYGVECWHIPDAAKEHVGLLRKETDGREVAVVDRALSDAYKKAFAYREAHRDAYDCLPEFVSLMNDLRTENLPDTLDEFLYFAKGAEDYREKVLETTLDEFVDSFGKYRYVFPSILDFLEYDGLPMAPLQMIQTEKKNFLDFLLFVFEEGRWKILIYPGMFF